MKKNIKSIIALLIILIIAFLVFEIVTKNHRKKMMAQTIKIMPKFNFRTMDNQKFSNENLLKNKLTIFINFNTECPYCQNEASSIQENIQKFNDCQILFISSEPINNIKSFAQKYQLSNLNNVVFLFDEKDTFSNIFDTNMIPYLLVYDKNNQLIFKHKGQVMAKKILAEIKK